MHQRNLNITSPIIIIYVYEKKSLIFGLPLKKYLRNKIDPFHILSSIVDRHFPNCSTYFANWAILFVEPCNLLPNDKNSDIFEVKAFVDNTVNVIEKIRFVETSLEKGEHVGFLHFLFFHNVFKAFLPFVVKNQGLFGRVKEITSCFTYFMKQAMERL